MWKLPFHVLGVEAYSDQIFKDLDECIKKHEDSIKAARRQVERKRMRVDKFLIFKHQTIALPPPEFDQRILGVGDQPGYEFEVNRPKSISFEE